MQLSTLLLGALLFSALSLALPQGPNTLAVNNPNFRTQVTNRCKFLPLPPCAPIIDESPSAWFLVPINCTTVQNSVPYPLLPLPTTDPSLFTKGYPAGKDPILVMSDYGSDI